MTWLLILLFLLCPLSMMFMHRQGGHSGAESNAHVHHGGEEGHHDAGMSKVNESSRIDDYKLKKLEGEIEYLRGQNEVLREKIEQLSKDHHSNTSY